VKRTRVVNCLHDDYDVYIGRAGKGHDGYHGNPFRRGPDDPPGSTLPKFKEYFLKRVEEDVEFRRRTLELKGKRLGCFCKPKRLRFCHGSVIVEWLDGPVVDEKGEQLGFFDGL
jgi:hypothetical protein